VAVIADGLLKELLDFREERDWRQFHTPRNLSTTLCIEAAELLECFQWAADSELSEDVRRERVAIEDEIADVAIVLSYLCHDLGLSLDDAVRCKLDKNRAKYPVDKARGNATKYDRL
jgi:NTP pyrophosphatase (non-canonical NTP hydrolase)